MKLSIVVLSSILAVCSVTTAIPVNPSATASAEASTSTVIPSAQVTPSTDLSQLPEEGMKLIKEYAQTKKSRDNAKETYGLTQSEMHVQEKLVKRLHKKIKKLPRKSQISENGSKYSEKLQKLEDKLEQERKNLDELIKKQLEFGCASLTFKLGKIKVQLVKYIFGGNLHYPFDYYMERLTASRQFMELVKTFGNYSPSQQLGSQQDSTSGAHSSSQQAPQGYDNSAFLYDDEMKVSENSGTMHSSSETPIVQPTQTSSNTQAASSSTQKASKSSRLQKVYREIKGGFELGWNQDESDDRKLLIDPNTNLD
ncbi:hypothetical protein BDEG_24927 [Batrachochytrium dendrobatidis JEL423]|uniref:Uncharacterized protein n=1 Tax=Batrachochytrium dendrobatidis (strain JEL423) TaxID=403673 RepID=A0A177WNC0_BATDL|nr:hypothetical protein BDEG_24927 [Batrachochytrium dendrobatidis JEL423]